MKLFFSVGEPSGDLHGSKLIRESSARRNASVTALGLGGPRMQAAGCQLLRDMTDLAIFGFFPSLVKLPQFLRCSPRWKSAQRRTYGAVSSSIIRASIGMSPAKQKVSAFRWSITAYQLWAWLSFPCRGPQVRRSSSL